MGEVKKKKIILSAGGTMGSVTPLLALSETLRREGFTGDFRWVGTIDGPERAALSTWSYQALPAGKWRRYFDWHNFTDLINIVRAFFISLAYLRRESPSLVVSSGSFVSVPLVWAAWCLRVKVILLQLDARPGLANRLMAPFARYVGVVFASSAAVYGSKARLVSLPMPYSLQNIRYTRHDALAKLGLRADKPVLMVMGGSSGAAAINELLDEALPALSSFCQVILISGRGKDTVQRPEIPGHRRFEFLDVEGMAKCYTASDIVVSRGGMGSILELAYLSKPAVFIPMPDTHQEDNVRSLAASGAALVLDQRNLTVDLFVECIKNLYNSNYKEMGAILRKQFEVSGQNSFSSLTLSSLND